MKQGEEIGMTDVCITVDSVSGEYSRCSDINSFPFMREFGRTPFQWDSTANAGFSNGTSTWLPVSENFQRVNLVAQQGRNGSHFEIYKHLMKLKKTEAAVNGSLKISALNDDILLILRDLDDEKKESLITIFNFGNQFTSLNFIDETALPENIKIKISRLNSFHLNGFVLQRFFYR